MTELWVALGADILAIGVLAYVIYFRRHFRPDLMLAYAALNLGVFAVTAVLADDSSAGIGLGLGLFGILSIIRLRSDAITQQEIAYYFVSLVLGLVCGLQPTPLWLAPTFAVLLVGVTYVVDHPSLRNRTSRQMITLDHAYPDPVHLQVALEQLLGAEILYASVTDLDLVRDTTVVDVRYRTVGLRAAQSPRVRGLSGRMP